MAASDSLWNDLHVAGWAGTKSTLHLYTQMLGKIRLALSPPQPNWMFTPLYFTPRGLTTGAMPYRERSLEAAIDVFDSTISLNTSDGRTTSIPLLPVRTIAQVYDDLTAALDTLGVTCTVTTVPQEVPDTTAMHQDHRPREYDPAAVRRWFDTCTAIGGAFDRWRSCFFGRSGVQLWWGAFDLALILFSGKRVPAPLDRGYIMKYDLDAQLMNVGLYLGDENTAPFFYGYIYPQPDGAETAPMTPGTAWSTQLREWTLPYETVRNAPDPPATLAGFIDAIYRVCFERGGWDAQAFTYDLPPIKANLNRSVEPLV